MFAPLSQVATIQPAEELLDISCPSGMTLLRRRHAGEHQKKKLFNSKMPFRHLSFLISIAEFHLEKFFTAQAVSSARAVLLGPAPQGVPEMVFYLK